MMSDCDVAKEPGHMFPSMLRVSLESVPRSNPWARSDRWTFVHQLCLFLSEPFAEATQGEVRVSQIGVIRHSLSLVLNASRTDNHDDDEVDWKTQHTMRYMAIRDGDEIVLVPLRKAEESEQGLVRWRGLGHASDITQAWEALTERNNGERRE